MPEGTLHILGIPGSLRRVSFNRGLLDAAQAVASAEMEIEFFDILPIPLYNPDVEANGDPVPVRTFKEKIRSSDGLLIATAEYNYSIPGVLKNAIDWASRPPERALRRKPVALMGASGGRRGTMRAQAALRQVLQSVECYAMPKPEIYVTNAQERFDAAGRLTDGQLREEIRGLLTSFVTWIRALGRRET